MPKKKLLKSPSGIDVYIRSKIQVNWEISSEFCGLLKKSQLYLEFWKEPDKSAVVKPRKLIYLYWPYCTCTVVLSHKKWYVFCFPNCSDLHWEKIVLVIDKIFWNSRLRAENSQVFWDQTICSKSEWSVQFFKQNAFLTCSWKKEYLTIFWEKIKTHNFWYFDYSSQNSHFLTRTVSDYEPFLDFQFPTIKSALLSLTIL